MQVQCERVSKLGSPCLGLQANLHFLGAGEEILLWEPWLWTSLPRSGTLASVSPARGKAHETSLSLAPTRVCVEGCTLPAPLQPH